MYGLRGHRSEFVDLPVAVAGPQRKKKKVAITVMYFTLRRSPLQEPWLLSSIFPLFFHIYTPRLLNQVLLLRMCVSTLWAIGIAIVLGWSRRTKKTPANKSYRRVDSLYAPILHSRSQSYQIKSSEIWVMLRVM